MARPTLSSGRGPGGQSPNPGTHAMSSHVWLVVWCVCVVVWCDCMGCGGVSWGATVVHVGSLHASGDGGVCGCVQVGVLLQMGLKIFGR